MATLLSGVDMLVSVNMLPGDDGWYVSREEIENNSPSRQDGIDLEEETRLRNSYCTFLKELGLRLKVHPIVLATAIALCHRFFLLQSHAKNDRLTIATICMFIAGKVEKATRLDLKQVIIVSHEIIHKKAIEPDQREEVYEQQKELVLSGEKLVFATFNFDVSVDLPFSPLIVAIDKYILDDATKAQFLRVARRFVMDSYWTTLCLQYKPRHIAGAVFFLAAKYVRMDLESNRESWCQEFDITPIQLEDIRGQMRPLYKKEPVPASTGSIGETSNSGDVVHQPVSGDVASTDQCPSSASEGDSTRANLSLGDDHSVQDRPEGTEKDKAESEAGEDSSVGNPAAETSDDVGTS
ncbi:unnamed protein product [Eruca vesicaria subsp. sativa]|uniref:Cyclin-like domain-containing protein n=1 Tax=Eruca vesicaria subsp. sativa TaxID=29727 RepID=A0ABC8M3R9_ERUVS|nr:unnamed protein product [Eruca vesicaria subsp. sativa]